jgi:hypothetical protein
VRFGRAEANGVQDQVTASCFDKADIVHARPNGREIGEGMGIAIGWFDGPFP